jgi:hypothetical protein
MLDIAIAYNRYAFLGNEFLTWLWFVIDKEPEKIVFPDQESATLETGNRIVLVKRINDIDETVTIKGDDAGLEEGMLALSKGSLVTEINLLLTSNNQKWRFSVKGESLNISGIKVPESGRVEAKEDIEGAIMEKAYLYERIFILLDSLFKKFIKTRLSSEWGHSVLPLIKKWIKV